MFCFCYHNNIVGGKSQPVFAAEIAVFLGNGRVQREMVGDSGIRGNSAGNNGKSWETAERQEKDRGRQNAMGNAGISIITDSRSRVQREAAEKVCAPAHTRAGARLRQQPIPLSAECPSTAKLFCLIGNEVSYLTKKPETAARLQLPASELGQRDSNPRDAGVKVLCLTAWRWPKNLIMQKESRKMRGFSVASL